MSYSTALIDRLSDLVPGKILAALALLSLASLGQAQTLISAPGTENFGQANANGSSAPVKILVYQSSGTLIPNFALKYGTEFKNVLTSCTGLGTISCSVSIKFQPQRAGLRQDAVLVTDKSGNLLATTLLSGLGLAPQMNIFPGSISTVAGKGSWGYSGDGGSAMLANLANPQGLALDNFGNLYISDSVNQVIRMVSATTGLISTIVGNGVGGYGGDGGLARQASLNSPAGIALDGAGNLYIADQGNNLVRKVNAKTQQITTVAGGGSRALGPDGLGDGGLAVAALLSGPSDVAVDASGNVFIADSFHGLVRKVDAVTGIISIVAGGGTNSGTDGLGDSGPAASAILNNPCGLALDAAGDLYIADTGHSLVRRVDASSAIITVVAGNGRYAYSGDGGLATNASLGSPFSVRLDPAGDLYIADQAESVVRKVNAATGTISTVAGTGARGYSGDGSIPTNSQLANPTSVVIDSAGNLWIADYTNNAVRKVNLNADLFSVPSTLVGEKSDINIVGVMNSGNQSLTFQKLSLSSGLAQQSLGSADCTSSSVLSAGAACSVAVQFVPYNPGAFTGTVLVTQNSLNATASSQIAVFTGTATATSGLPQLSIAPSSLTFAAQPLGTMSSSQSVTISNVGSGPLSISSIQLAGLNAADYVYSSNCGSVLAAGARCSVSVAFSPTVGGTRTASLVMVDNLATSPQALSISGTAGSAQVGFNSTTLNFAGQPSGSTSTPQTVIISDTGTAPLNISSIAIAGANASDFSMTSGCGSSVPAGGNCSLKITFSPHRIGLRAASIIISDNGAGSSQTVTLNGRGTIQSEPAVWRPSNGNWYYSQISSSTTAATQWGIAGDIPVPGDYDGDGKTDFAMFRPSTGTWYIIQSSTGTVITKGWGGASYIPVPGDYDGDGKTDIAVFLPLNGTWNIIPSSTGAPLTKGWGSAGDVPVPGDYDGDGKTDIAVYHPSNGVWDIILSRTWSPLSKGWGSAGDVPVPGDYDGDGKTDIAVFVPSIGSWCIIESGTGAGVTKGWGGSGDTPVQGDYDGDGKTDIAVFHPSNGTWDIILSKAYVGVNVRLGATGDTPISGLSKR